MWRRSVGLSAFALFLAAAAGAQTPPCNTAQHAEFDFWQGAWAVSRSSDGATAGSNRIQKILGGCVLHEQWRGADGSVGQSFNFVDQGEWRQVWVDARGGVLDLRGGLDQGAMVLRGKRGGRNGGKQLHEIRWTPRDDGTIRQHWRASTDGGKTWNDVFDGLYARSE